MKAFFNKIFLYNHKQKGLTLVEVAIVLVILGLMIGLGASLIGPLTKRAKLQETRDIVKAAKEAVLGYVVKHKRLPVEAEFRKIVQDKDAWGNKLDYYPVQDLTSGDACCSNATGFTINDRGTSKENTAFIILSMGENGTNNTVTNNNGTPPTFTIKEYSDTYDDLVQYVTIDELKDRVLSCQSLEITTTTLPEAEEDTPYFTKIIWKGGCNPKFSLQDGNLPEKLKLSSDGLISGTVDLSSTTPGTLTDCYYTNTFTVRLSESDESERNFVDKKLRIITKPQTLRITNASDLPSGTVGGAYNVTLYGAGGKNSYSWEVSSGSLPPGLNLSTGVISGTPTTAGVYNFVVSLSDGCTTTSRAFTITITSGGGDGGGGGVGGGCIAYRVWNQTGATQDFTVSGVCRNNRGNGTEITTTTITLNSGGSISRHTSTRGNCTSSVIQTLTYSQAQAADKNGNCQVNFTLNGFTDR